ncbi:MAG: hypothetical protein CL526_04250 [Aequorivita sp.]|nr:hypothetical protein [Aequorivita sp.]|tara:strand:- start:46095 stop:46535 length:441 start_codon:yes stop_codon:yes gene_type:complete
MRKFTAISILLLTVLFMSCDETKKVIDVAGNVQLTGSYDVVSLKGEKLGKTPHPTFTLSAINNSLRGTTGCNSVFGSYSIDLYAINFTDIAVSEKMCAETDVMKTERNFLDALNNSGSFTIENNTLTLFSKTDRSVLLTAKKEGNN